MARSATGIDADLGLLVFRLLGGDHEEAVLDGVGQIELLEQELQGDLQGDAFQIHVPDSRGHRLFRFLKADGIDVDRDARIVRGRGRLLDVLENVFERGFFGE